MWHQLAPQIVLGALVVLSQLHNWYLHRKASKSTRSLVQTTGTILLNAHTVTAIKHSEQLTKQVKQEISQKLDVHDSNICSSCGHHVARFIRDLEGKIRCNNCASKA